MWSLLWCDLAGSSPGSSSCIDWSSSCSEPNTSLLHLEILEIEDCSGRKNEWMDHLTTVLRSNASLIFLNLAFSAILEEEQPRSCRVHWNVVHTFLGALDLRLRVFRQSRANKCWGSLRTCSYVTTLWWKLVSEYTGLQKDGDAKLVYGKMRARDDDIDLVVMKQFEYTIFSGILYAEVEILVWILMALI